MKPDKSQDTRWTWLQMTRGPKRQRASLQELNHVGEFRKNLSPSKRQVWQVSWNEFSGWLNIAKIWNLESTKPRSRESAKIWNLEPTKPRSRESVNIWNLEPVKPRSRESAKIRNLEPAKPWSHEPEKTWNRNLWNLEIYWRSNLEVMVRRLWRLRVSMNKRLANQQEAKSKSLPQKSGFGVWTSGRLVNVWDVKDIHVCVHIRNIPWILGYFRNVKLPSSPYKRGTRARVKWLTTFEAWAVLRRFFVSSCIICVLERVCIPFSCVWGSHPKFRIPPTNQKTVKLA
jgi:hypothetical protein